MKRPYRTPAISAANKFFKQTPEKAATDYEKAELALHVNMERLKAERLAREAEQRARRDGKQ